MHSLYINFKKSVQAASLVLMVLLLPQASLRAQTDCGVTKNHGRGYSSTISSVTDNGDDSYTIVLTVEHDGCDGPYCKEMSHYSVEAEEDTYYDISVGVISGSMTYCNIDMGHNLGGDPIDGFKVDGVSGIGDGQAGVFTVTYTLTGGLQQQKTLVKAGIKRMSVCFTLEEFQSVLECGSSDIIPYYPPPEDGKIFNSLIGAELTSLFETYSDTASYEDNDIFQIIDSGVLIEIHALEGMYEDLLSLLTTPDFGLTQEEGDPDLLLITGLYPISNLLLLNELTDLLDWARPEFPAIGNVGLMTSQGDTSLRSYIARDAFGVMGAGIKVGVLSDSFNKKLGNPAGDDVIKGDLPGPANPVNQTPVQVLAEYPYSSGSDEGRAMLQIIHDIAPKADLAFRTGFISAFDFATGIRELQVAGCDVIVDDITYITQPFFYDGIVAQAVDEVVSEGVAYFSAAGNFGGRSYQNVFSPTTAPSGITGEAHNYTPGEPPTDIHQSISLTQGSYTIVLQWDDGSDFEETNTDLDIYLSNANGTTLFGFNRDNTGAEPIEVLPFTVTAESAGTNIMIVRAAGSGTVTFKYIVFRGNLIMNEYANTGTSTLVGHPNSAGAIAVGAVLYSNTPEYGVNPPTMASFSSLGGTSVDGIVRNKPDITAPNGVNTSVNLGGVNIDGDPFPNFFGTSAAAPHAAGVAALMMEAKAKYYGTNMTPSELRSILQSTALDMNTPGYDNSSGYGFIQADEALLSLANPSPVITALVYDTTKTLGAEPLEITVIGKYLTDESVIYFNGSPLDSSTVVLSDTAITATVPVFEERYPAIQVYNPPNAQTNGTDGGMSNPLYFTTKKTIVVTIQDTTKIYGEVIPEFTALYAVESLEGTTTLEEEGLSGEAILRIESVDLVTLADALSNTGIWEIIATGDDPLNPESTVTATDSLDIALLDAYNFDFERGLLTIEKMDLLIVPEDSTITFGDSITGFKYNYYFNSELANPDELIEINGADSLAILNLLLQSHATALVNAIGTVRATALVNEQGDPMLDSLTLANKSVVISNALATKRATALVNGTLLDPEAFLNAALGSPATALVNGMGTLRATALVNGTATALVNGTPTALVNAAALSFATALVNTTTVNEANNDGAILLLSEDDISILAGDSTGNIVLNSISLITGDSAGTHWIIPGALLSINFNITYGLGRLTIEKDTADMAFDLESLTHTYDGTSKQATVETVPSGLSIDLTYNGSSAAPVNAGEYLVVATVNDPNYLGSTQDTLYILPAQGTVTADNKVIKAGDPAPTYTATFSGFVNGEDETVVSDLSFTIIPAYTGAAGTYEIIPDAEAGNYLFTPVNGNLYVNPFGWGAKHIKVDLVCVEELAADSLGFSYIAHFEYENENATDVYIAVGDRNKLISQGSYYCDSQPELFISGGGTFDVLFDGSILKWRVRSYHNYFLITSLAIASYCSPSCYKSSQIAEGELEEQMQEEGNYTAYPNPTGDVVFIDLQGEQVSGDEVIVYDQFGKICPVNGVQSTNEILKIDLTGQRAGLYLISVILGGKNEVFRIIKK